MKRIYLLTGLTALILSHTWLLAQVSQTTWLDYGNDANGEGLIFKTNYGYITFCGYVPLETFKYGVMVTGLTTSHEVLFQKPLISEEASYGMYLAQSIIEANDFGYYQVLFYSTSSTQGYPMLVRYNDVGDTLWTKTYFPDDPFEYRDFVLTQLADNNLLLAGTHNLDPFNSSSAQPWKQAIVKLNSEGDFISINEYSGYRSIWNYSIMATEDGYLTGGRMCLNSEDVWNYRFRDFIRKFDNNGNSQWFTKIQVPPAGAEGGVYSLLPNTNGNYLYTGGRSAGTLGGSGETSNVYTRGVIGEINALSGDTLYELHCQQEQWPWQDFYKLKQCTSGGYIGVGTHFYFSEGELSGWRLGYMVKLDAALNLEWYRYYVPGIWEGMGRWNNLTDVVENDNGTFTAVGMIYTHTGNGPQNGFIQDTYLITVDQLGCLVPGCEVAVQEVEIEDDLTIYPNPANDYITVQFPMPGKWTIGIYNMQGQLQSHESAYQIHQHTLSLMTLPSGIYLVNCISAQGKVYRNRIIKN